MLKSHYIKQLPMVRLQKSSDDMMVNVTRHLDESKADPEIHRASFCMVGESL